MPAATPDGAIVVERVVDCREPWFLEQGISHGGDPAQRGLEDSVAAYVIYQGEVLDPARYDEYRHKAAESIAAAGGRYIVRGGDVEVLEGEPPAGRTVVLEFPTRDAALAWYHGDEYTEIRKIREGAARARMYVVDGYE